MAVTISGSGQVIVQVKSTILTTAFSTSSSTLVDVTGLSVNITPTSASNKILIFVNMFQGTANSGGSLWAITRNGTLVDISTDATTTARRATGGYYTESGGSAGNTWNGAGTAYLDSPATTSAITYQVQYSSLGGTSYVNRRAVSTDLGGTSTITVMEISGT
jgi:hypothetical protein